MALTLDLAKSEQALRLSLAKAGVNMPPAADVAFDLDVTGSFEDEHESGQTQTLLERLVPWGMVFDPDKKLDAFTFSDGSRNAHYVGEITPQTSDGFIRKRIIRRVPGYGGATEYSHVIEKNLEHFGWSGRRLPIVGKQPRRSIILFVTDGDNSDHQRTEEVLATSEARRDQVYFLFIGVSNQGGTFPFLRKIGNRFGNTGLVVIRDLRRFTRMTDEELNAELIGDELVRWLNK